MTAITENLDIEMPHAPKPRPHRHYQSNYGYIYVCTAKGALVCIENGMLFRAGKGFDGEEHKFTELPPGTSWTMTIEGGLT